MLTFEIKYQPGYSRGEILLLCTFFGVLYLALPHILAIFIFGIALWFMTLASFFIVLFTCVTPPMLLRWGGPVATPGIKAQFPDV